MIQRLVIDYYAPRFMQRLRKTFKQKPTLHLNIKRSSVPEVFICGSHNEEVEIQYCYSRKQHDEIDEQQQLGITIEMAFHNILTEESIRVLSTIQWPKLNQLDLGGFTEGSANQLEGNCGKWLSMCLFPELETIKLVQPYWKRRLGVFNKRKMEESQKIAFKSIALKRCDLFNFSSVNWKDLCHINLSCNSISRKRIKQIVKGEFCLLEDLFLGGCSLDDEGCIELAKGKWTVLRCLRLADNLFGSRGVKYLVMASWAQLFAAAASVDQQYFGVSIRQFGKTNFVNLHIKFEEWGSSGKRQIRFLKNQNKNINSQIKGCQQDRY